MRALFYLCALEFFPRLVSLLSQFDQATLAMRALLYLCALEAESRCWICSLAVYFHHFFPAQEYELQRQLMLKLKCMGVNAAFSLRSDVRNIPFGEFIFSSVPYVTCLGVVLSSIMEVLHRQQPRFFSPWCVSLV